MLTIFWHFDIIKVELGLKKNNKSTSVRATNTP